MADPPHRHDRPRQLALQRSGQLHLLVELGHREVGAAVKYFVAGDALLPEPAGGQQIARRRHVGVRDQDLVALLAELDLSVRQFGDQLPQRRLIQIGRQHTHAGSAGALKLQPHKGAQQSQGHANQHGNARHAQLLDRVDQALHAVPKVQRRPNT